MPGQGQTIVVGGGISGVAPLALGQYLYLSNLNPPNASSSPRLRFDSNDIIAESEPNQHDVVIGFQVQNLGTQFNEDVLIGSRITRTTAGSGGGAVVAIGSALNMSNVLNSVVIGQVTGGIGNDNVLIGQNIQGAGSGSGVAIGINIPSVGGQNSVTLGRAASTTGTGIAIGGSASANGNFSNAVCVGTSSHAGNWCVTVGGGGTTGGATGTILIGFPQSVGNVSNMIMIGHQGTGFQVGLQPHTVYVGSNNIGGAGQYTTAVVWGGTEFYANGQPVPAWTTRYRSASGGDQGAGDVIHIAPRGTGAGLAGEFQFLTSPPGVSGTTLQTPVRRFTVSRDGNIALGDTPDYGGGAGVMFLQDAPTPPATNPVGGGILYASGGALFYRGSAGTITPLAPA